MPLRLLDYSVLEDTSKLPVWREKYETFGKEIISILENQAREKGVQQYEFMSNLLTMRRLLGDSYNIRAVSKPREHPIKTLRASVQSKKRVCIIEGAVRYIIIGEKKVH